MNATLSAPNTPARSSGRGCLFYGCLTFIILIFLVICAVVLGLRWGVLTMTAPEPLALAIVDPSPNDLSRAQTLVQRIKDGINGKVVDGEPIAITEGELQAIVQTVPELSFARGYLSVGMEDNHVSIQFSAPVDLKLFTGTRYFTGSVVATPRITKGKLELRMRDLHFGTISEPKQSEDVGEYFMQKNADNGLAQAVRRIESAEIRDGVLYIQFPPSKKSVE